MDPILKIESISQFHELIGVPPPHHPLVSLIESKDIGKVIDLSKTFGGNIRFSASMYSVMFKGKMSGSIGYGRNSYDFEEGTLIFGSPDQVFSIPEGEAVHEHDGWTLLFHPDLIRKSPLATKMNEYTFFNYEVNEALHLSNKEKVFVKELVNQIEEEYSQNLDRHSQSLIVANIELLLNYCLRFYDRQFLTRTNLNSDLTAQFEGLLKDYFSSEELSERGIPQASFFGSEMGISTNYLSDMLKKSTGKSTKQHIDDYVVTRAKTQLLSSQKSVSEIAYGLGFEYPQSFSRLFKTKTGMSPNAYRNLN